MQKLDKGVVYYNTDNEDNLYNEDNSCNRFSRLVLGLATDVALSPGGLSFSQEGAEPLTVVLDNQAPTPLDEDQVKSWIAQLWDNGEGAFQRYKFKIRLNLTDGTNPEFIASLTKDMRNFKKHLPDLDREAILSYVNQRRHEIKKQTEHFPYVGKFHLNQGPRIKKHQVCNQVEPGTLVIVWWDTENKGWNAEFLIENFSQQLSLFTEYLTKRQRSLGVKAQDSWRNPKYDITVRPKTWAQQRFPDKCNK